MIFLAQQAPANYERPASSCDWVLTRRTTIFKTNPVSFPLLGSPFADRMGLELRLAEVFSRDGMMRTILNAIEGVIRALGNAG